MKILVSPTAFKGTLSPFEAARIIVHAARKKFPPSSIKMLPLADGGDGTLEVLLGTLGGKKISTRVTGPLEKKIKAEWAIIDGKKRMAGGRTGVTRMGVIEMARASGLALIKGKNRAMKATSFGTGELIRAALNRGCEKILIGVGGAASSDGGAGALQALGLAYFDKDGNPLSSQPKDLIRMARVDWSSFDKRLSKAKIFVLCDVTNPLLGPRGSARTFSPQKGATPSQVKTLEAFLRRWASFAKVDARNVRGAGAAGALAFGLAGFAGAKLVEGTPFIMKTLKWKEKAKKANLILTGEGRFDKTSFSGKVIGEIAKHRGRAKVVVVCGSSTLSSAEAKRRGIERVELLKEFA